jgi:hypothetical protein
MPRTIVDSPIGPLGLIASDVGLRAVLFDGRRVRPEGRSPVLAEATRQLDAYFEGDPVTLTCRSTSTERSSNVAAGARFRPFRTDKP